MQIYLRKYGVSGTCNFSLYDPTASSILVSAVFTSGCCIISKDEGTSALSANLPVVRSNDFSIKFTDSELTSKRLFVKLVDQQWLAHSFCIETYGTSASQHGSLASGMLDEIIDVVSVRQFFTEAIAVLVGDIIKSGDNYSFLSRDGSTTVLSLSAALGNRIRN